MIHLCSDLSNILKNILVFIIIFRMPDIHIVLPTGATRAPKGPRKRWKRL